MPDEFQTLKKERCIEIIKACNGSGVPKRQWCREHGIGYSTFMRWQRSLRNELAGEIMVTQAVVPLQIEPQASRCSSVQEITIQKIRNAKGQAFKVTSAAEVAAILKELEVMPYE